MSHTVETHVAHNVDRRESSETKKPKKPSIKRTWSPGVNYFPRGKLTWQNKKLKVVSCNKLTVTVVGKNQPRWKEVTWTKQQQLEMVLAGVD